MKRIFYSFIALFLLSLNAKSQCTFTVQSQALGNQNNYTVVVTLKPKTVNTSSPCAYGYNYTVNIDYTITMTGNPPSEGLYTLQGNLGCGTNQSFFSLPLKAGTGTVTTFNQYSFKTDCATATPVSLNCNTIILQIQGLNIPNQYLTCGFNLCNAGTVAPTLSATTKSNICPASTVDISTITASNTPANTVLEWHTSNNPTSATKLTAVTTLGAGTYYATFRDAVNNCYSPTSSVTTTVVACCNAGTVSPTLSATTKSNVCPASTVDISTITASNIPANTVLEWHTSNNPTSATKLTAVTALSAGTYYATFRDAVNNCYSPTRAFTTTVVACCNAGTVSPTLSATTKSNVCPASTVDISTITASNTPTNTVLEWHTSNNPTSATKLTAVTALGAGIYYATFHDLVNNCYSPASVVTTTVVACCNAGTVSPTLSATTKSNVCPASTVDISTITASNTPANTVLEWHTSNNPTSATKLTVVTVLSAGTYYATFHDLVNNCYSPTSTITTTVATCCNAGNDAPILSATTQINICPATTVNLTTVTFSNLPSGTVLEWHTSINPTSATKLTAINALAAGTYYAIFHDLINNCYSPASAVVAMATNCNSTGISSGNEGGLESDDCLAQAIAQRNYQRKKTPSVNADGNVLTYDNPKELVQFSEPIKGGLGTRSEKDLSSFIPQNPFATASSAYLSTPNDLIGITNAKKVLSVDYFDKATQNRMAAVLSTQTQNNVYNHTKVICDRLIGSQLLSAEKVEIDEKPFILSALKRENGTVEYYINFSVNKENATSVLVTSQWSPEDYLVKPDYWNFQVWTDSPENAKKLTLEILNKFKEQFPTLNSTVLPSIPKVFVKKGGYDNGILTLTIQNPIAATQITLSGNYTNSETQKRTTLYKTLNLTGEKEQKLEIYVGSIYDMGFNLKNNKSGEYDALYFADGAWGLDYEKANTKIDYFEVNSAIPNGQNDAFTVERSPLLRGTTKDYVSLFRSLRPGSVEADMSKFSNLSFSAKGINNTVTVTLVKKSIAQWSKQYRTEIQLSGDKKDFVLPLKDFKNGTNEVLKADDLVDVVFTIKGDGKTDKAYEMSIENLVFDNKAYQKAAVAENTVKAYPNPASDVTELIFDIPNSVKGQISVTNLHGKQVSIESYDLQAGRNHITVPVYNLPSGVYMISVITPAGKMNTKVIVP